MKSLSQTFADTASLELKKGYELNHVLSSLRTILEKNNLQTLYPYILEKIKKNTQKELNFRTYTIETPFELNSETFNSILDKMPNSDSDPQVTIINKKLLAGFKITHRGRVYDASLQNYIKHLFR